MERQCSLWTKNTKDLQAFDSAVCGQYCTMYLLFKAHGFSMQKFVSCFSLDCNKNDKIVNKMFQRYAKNVNLCDDVLQKKTQSCCKKRKCKKN